MSELEMVETSPGRFVKMTKDDAAAFRKKQRGEVSNKTAPVTSSDAPKKSTTSSSKRSTK